MTYREFIDVTADFSDETPVKLHTPNPDYGIPVTLLQTKGDFVSLTYDEDHLPKTVGYLRTLLKENPEIADRILTAYIPELNSNQNNIIRYVSWNGDKTVIAVNDKRGEDVREELKARMEAYIADGMNDADALQDAFDAGFTLLDFKEAGRDAYEWAEKTKREYGCVELAEKLSIA